jgi:hypothetical protein
MGKTSHIKYFNDCSTVAPYPPKGTGGTIVGTGDYEYYCIKLPIPACLRLFWGVKKWKLSYDYDFHILIDDESTDDSNGYLLGSEITGSGSVELVSGDGYSTSNLNYIHLLSEKETDLFCKNIEPETNVLDYGWDYPVTYTRKIIKNEGTEEEPEIVTTVDELQDNLYAAFGSGGGSQQEFFSRFSETEDPSNEFWVSLILTLSVGFSAGYSQFDTPTFNISRSTTATLKFLNYQIPIELGATSLPSYVLKSEVSNVILEPYEWWTYDGKYDSETGLEN